MAHTVKLRDLGPDYLRSRMLNRDSALHRRHRLSAVDLLEKSKKQFVKTESVLDKQQSLQNSSLCSRGVTSSQSTEELLHRHDQSNDNTAAMKVTEQCQQLCHKPVDDCLVVSPVCNKHSSSADNTLPTENTSTCIMPNSHHSVTCGDDLENVQSDLSELSLKRPKYNDKMMELNDTGTGTDSAENTDRQVMTTGAVYNSAENQQQAMRYHSPVSSSQMINNEVKKHCRPVGRSLSDLSKRMSNSSDLSELSSRLSRNSSNLEKFFNEMGLERDVLDPMVSAQRLSGEQSCSSISNFMESMSSIDSLDGHSFYSNPSKKMVENGLKSVELVDRLPIQASIVERNARIIKWLCTVRKASTPRKEMPL